MGDRPEQNRYGLVFSELHSVNLADIDGDGLKDIVTGKTYYSHHKQAPMWDAGAVVYWFRLDRTPEGVDWVPYQADGEAGIGRQLVVADINGDGLPDIATGGMKGAHVLIHEREAVDKAALGGGPAEGDPRGLEAPGPRAPGVVRRGDRPRRRGDRGRGDRDGEGDLGQDRHAADGGLPGRALERRRAALLDRRQARRSPGTRLRRARRRGPTTCSPRSRWPAITRSSSPSSTASPSASPSTCTITPR